MVGAGRPYLGLAPIFNNHQHTTYKGDNIPYYIVSLIDTIGIISLLASRTKGY